MDYVSILPIANRDHPNHGPPRAFDTAPVEPTRHPDTICDRLDPSRLTPVFGHSRCVGLVEHGLENFPLHLQGRLQLCNTPHGLYLAVDPLDIWISASTDEECAHALRLFLYQKVYKARRECLSHDDLQWSLGDCFCESVMRLGFLANRGRMRTLLRACADTILNENLSQTRWLRTGSGAEDPQLRRGHDKAWRRSIDHEYRLHYWETELGPELACVVVHKDMSIPL
jgi:hypothetical protein